MFHRNRQKKHVTLQEAPVLETTPLVPKVSSGASDDGDNDNDNDDDDHHNDGEDDGEEYFDGLKHESVRRESMAADRLSMRLLQVADDDSETEDQILRETLDISVHGGGRKSTSMSISQSQEKNATLMSNLQTAAKQAACERLCTMISLVSLAFGLIAAALWVGVEFIGPPNQPVGPYELVERQEGAEFFNFYTFYEGPDSVGSNGYITYVSKDRAKAIEIANVTQEEDVLDVYDYQSHRKQKQKRKLAEEESSTTTVNNNNKKEPFLYLKSAPTEEGPRESIRLEGKRRFNRGLFIIDVRHMPAGCGVWPAFWLTDEANWPVNGEIDIVEGINYQSEAKTALHSTKGCDMFDVPMGTMTGTWDTAVGIPNRKTGIPDMTPREAQNCFVYDPHQWLNQGCVAVDTDGDSLGIPLNSKGGGVFVLEWDPVNRHIRTWVFSPHTKVPENLVEAIRTAHEPIPSRIMPDPSEWPLPYGYLPVGDNTNCPASHFRNMRLVLNTAFCGSVSGNRFNMDCKKQAKSFKTCNSYVKSQPEELEEAYWKIRGVYVYERAWEKAWIR